MEIWAIIKVHPFGILFDSKVKVIFTLRSDEQNPEGDEKNNRKDENTLIAKMTYCATASESTVVLCYHSVYMYYFNSTDTVSKFLTYLDLRF